MDSYIVKIKQFEYMKVTGNLFSVSDAWPFVTWEVTEAKYWGFSLIKSRTNVPS